MAKRKMSAYQLFATSFLRARGRPGMKPAQMRELMREAANAWRRARRGENPFPGLDADMDMAGTEDGLEFAGEGHIEHLFCPVCGEALEVPQAAVGRIGSCGACGSEFEVLEVEPNPNKLRQQARHETRLAWSRGMGDVNRELKQTGSPGYYMARHAHRRLMRGKPYAGYGR
jgi:hypothetical protein